MTPVETLRGQRVALFGLGGSGMSTVRALVAGGAEVAVWDDNPRRASARLRRGFRSSISLHADWRVSSCSCCRLACR